IYDNAELAVEVVLPTVTGKADENTGRTRGALSDDHEPNVIVFVTSAPPRRCDWAVSRSHLPLSRVLSSRGLLRPALRRAANTSMTTCRSSRLSKELLAAPANDLWRNVIRRLAVPADVEALLLTELERIQ